MVGYEEEKERLLQLVPDEYRKYAETYLDRRYEFHSRVGSGKGFDESRKEANKDLEDIISAQDWTSMLKFLVDIYLKIE